MSKLDVAYNNWASAKRQAEQRGYQIQAEEDRLRNVIHLLSHSIFTMYGLAIYEAIIDGNKPNVEARTRHGP
jgi:hypothetical protein